MYLPSLYAGTSVRTRRLRTSDELFGTHRDTSDRAPCDNCISIRSNWSSCSLCGIDQHERLDVPPALSLDHSRIAAQSRIAVELLLNTTVRPSCREPLQTPPLKTEQDVRRPRAPALGPSARPALSAGLPSPRSLDRGPATGQAHARYHPERNEVRRWTSRERRRRQACWVKKRHGYSDDRVGEHRAWPGSCCVLVISPVVAVQSPIAVPRRAAGRLPSLPKLAASGLAGWPEWLNANTRGRQHFFHEALLPSADGFCKARPAPPRTDTIAAVGGDAGA